MTNNFDINEIRRQFPILDRTVYGKPLVYFDNAATTQKPLCVIERERDYYLNENCNIHRGVHYLSQEATEAYENARKTIASFLNAKENGEFSFPIIFYLIVFAVIMAIGILLNRKKVKKNK